MPKITTYQTDKNGIVQKNNDGEKIVDRQLNMIFPVVDNVVGMLKGEKFQAFLKQHYPQYLDDFSSIANLFDSGATVKCQSLSRSAMGEKTEDGKNVHSDSTVLQMGIDATIKNVDSRKFDPEKAAARIAPTVAKLSDVQLAELGLSRVPVKKVVNS